MLGVAPSPSEDGILNMYIRIYLGAGILCGADVVIWGIYECVLQECCSITMASLRYSQQLVFEVRTAPRRITAPLIDFEPLPRRRNSTDRICEMTSVYLIDNAISNAVPKTQREPQKTFPLLDDSLDP